MGSLENQWSLPKTGLFVQCIHFKMIDYIFMGEQATT